MKELIDTMKEGAQHPILVGFNFIGGVSGFLACATLVFYGGAIVQKVKDLDGRVAALEHSGSSSVREHIKEDDAREMAMAQRVAVLEEAVRRLALIDGDVREIKTTLKFYFDGTLKKQTP